MSPPGDTGGAFSAPPDPLAGFKGDTSWQRLGKEQTGEMRDHLSPYHHQFLDPPLLFEIQSTCSSVHS